MNHINTIDPELPGANPRVYSNGRVHSVTGWPLDPIIALDGARPGFLADVCRSRPRWRQSLYAAFASGVMDRPAEFLARCGVDERGGWGRVLGDLASALLTLDPRDIVVCSLGLCPEGYLAVLERLWFEPFRDPAAYIRLHTIFMEAGLGRQRRTILQIAHFDEDRLEAVERLDPSILTPTMIGRVRTGEAADRLNTMLALVRRYCSTATDDALAKSASDLAPVTSWNRWVRNWLERADQNLPAPPWSGDDTIRPLRTGADLAEAGRVTRTCVGTRVPVMASGRVAYFLAEGREVAIVCVIRLDDGSWLLSRIAGFNNRSVSGGRSAELRSKFQAAGIRVLAEVSSDPEFGTMLGAFDPMDADEFDLDGLED